MVTRSIVFALSLLLIASARCDLQFAPKESSYDLEGIQFHQLSFSDGSGKEITYQHPFGWNYSGSSAKLTLHPPNKGQAEGTITKVALPKPGVFDDESVKELVKQVLASVPNGSTDVNMVSQENNPVKIGGKETFLVIISYVFYGERYERSMMFMNRGAEQIRFQFVSRAVDFQDLQRAFLASQFTWQNL